jgi:hypothetical protein
METEEQQIYTFVNLTNNSIHRFQTSYGLTSQEALKKFVKKERFYSCFKPGIYIVVTRNTPQFLVKEESQITITEVT